MVRFSSLEYVAHVDAFVSARSHSQIRHEAISDGGKVSECALSLIRTLFENGMSATC